MTGFRSNKLFHLWCYFFFTTYLVKDIDAVPADYCNIPINLSDCGGPPTPVFSYWKPGSRCEIQIWRGCPGYNRFDNEMTCNHYCIGRVKLDSSENADSDENKIDSPRDPCDGELNTDDCGGTSAKVYTFDHEKKICVKAEWKGCTTKNMFRSKEKCAEICKKYGDIADWAKKIEKLTKQQLQQLNAMLDEYLSGKKNSQNESSDDPTTTESKTKGSDSNTTPKVINSDSTTTKDPPTQETEGTTPKDPPT